MVSPRNAIRSKRSALHDISLCKSLRVTEFICSKTEISLKRELNSNQLLLSLSDIALDEILTDLFVCGICIAAFYCEHFQDLDLRMNTLVELFEKFSHLL